MTAPTFGSLFAGIGGIDLGLERAGWQCAWQSENNRQCLSILDRHWPDTSKFRGDMRDEWHAFPSVDLVAGGDPCPKHSRARSIWTTKSPDLAGYFLAVVGRLRPRWVVRENVLAPTVDHFHAALETIGYAATVIRMDGAEITGQLRQREFVIGEYQASRGRIREMFSDAADGTRPITTSLKARPLIACLNTHSRRYDSRGNYIWEEGREGLRLLDGDEREAFSGFPRGWTIGLSETARARMYGNSVMPQMAEWIGRRILESMKVGAAPPQRGLR